VPGEAEAELALLNLLGHVDAIITSDGDSFIFGAHTVLRSYVFLPWTLIQQNYLIFLRIPTL
jgi:5'-3' exonuclease